MLGTQGISQRMLLNVSGACILKMPRGPSACHWSIIQKQPSHTLKMAADDSLNSKPWSMIQRQPSHTLKMAADDSLNSKPKPWLFVGLGNPGKLYNGTRHNVGFEMIDTIARAEGISVSRIQFKALFGKGHIDGMPVLLAKPQTFMNASGESVGQLAAYYKIPIDQVLLIFDCMDLPFATLRLLPKGGHGGHNGMKSVIDHFKGNREFPRLRIGIGRPPGKMDAVNYVLRPFTKQEREEVRGLRRFEGGGGLGFSRRGEGRRRGQERVWRRRLRAEEAWGAGTGRGGAAGSRGQGAVRAGENSGEMGMGDRAVGMARSTDPVQETRNISEYLATLKEPDYEILQKLGCLLYRLGFPEAPQYPPGHSSLFKSSKSGLYGTFVQSFLLLEPTVRPVTPCDSL
ncbi:hypothetical protein KI387_037256 [Taxus chinensis]|uniref:peptidyl-tRNA hydrolase n=1 Tax=Taxus chinensis TaxID=29808 RepID=A0AA38FS44_TAXCH|nr:hypothetical protein KI387_037256 [Taxus chinensis]